MLYYKDWRTVPVDGWLWPNFSPGELRCKGTGSLLINPGALDALQKLRNSLGRPMSLTSAYRSPMHNKRVGGATNSKHMMGIAFDVTITDAIPQAELVEAALDAGFRGIGRYPTFTHIDLRAEKVVFR